MDLGIAILASIVATLIVGLLGFFFKKPLNRLAHRLLLRLAVGRLGPIEIIKESADADPLLRKKLESSNRVRILQVRGHDLLARRADEALRNNLRKRSDRGLETQVLLLNPHSSAAWERAKMIGLSPISFQNGIQASMGEIEEMRKENIAINLRLYNSKPIFSLAIFDDSLILSFYVINKDRQAAPALIIQDRSVFYEAFSAYFDSLWTSNSVSPEHLTYHFEIEIKAKILDYQAVLKGLEKLDAQLTDSKRYHDHYFTPVDGPYAEDSGEELRVRCDLQRQRMFYTEKRPFREEWAGSKREFEIYVGSTTEQKPFCRSIEARGYRQYSSFFKEADFYTLNYGTFHINIALASVYSEATEEDTESGGHRDFIEIEVIQPEKANEEILKRAHQACENVLEGFGEAVSAVTDETYSGLFAERA